MLSGPSTLFSYTPAKPPKNQKKRRYGFPVVVPCYGCNAYVVRLFSPVSRRSVFIPLATFAAHPSLVYRFDLHGDTHFHPRTPQKPRV